MAVAFYAGIPLDLFQRLAIGPAAATAFTFTPFGPHLVCLNHAGPLPSFKIEKEEGTEER